MAYFDKYGVEFSDDRKTLIKCPENFSGGYVIPDNVIYISMHAFQKCKELTSINIGKGITSIGGESFEWCIKLENLEIPSNVEYIDSKAFANCTKLSIVRICNPNIYICPTAFLGCSSITHVEFTSLEVNNPYLAISAFPDCENLISVDSLMESVLVKDLREKVSSELKYMSMYYRQFNMNITQIKWAESIKTDKAFKEPIDTNWEVFKTKPQPLSYALSQNWENSQGIGVILGHNQYRALDVDNVNVFLMKCYYGDEGFNVFINHFLDILGLPHDYSWVIMSGSGVGFHIIFRTKDIDDNIDSLSFAHNDQYGASGNGETYEQTHFGRIELRWVDHLILPPSIHASGNRYTFRNGELPSDAPQELDLSKINDLLNHYCAEIRVTSHKYKEQNFYLAEKLKIYSRNDSYLSPHEHTEDSLGWLEASNSGESKNSLALRYIFANGLEFNKDKAFRLLTQANTQTSMFNLLNLYVCGFFCGCDYLEIHKLLLKLDKRIFKEEYISFLEKNVNMAIKKPKYIFFDTETTGVPRNYKAPMQDTANWPRLVQLAWLLVDEKGTELKRKSVIIRPDGFSIPEETVRVHGITTERAQKEGLPLRNVLDEFMQDLELAEEVVGHNIDFDIHIVGAELCRLGLSTQTISKKPTTCTMKSFTDFCAIPSNNGYGGYKWPTLEELYYKVFGCKMSNAHDALADILATKECFFELKNQFKAKASSVPMSAQRTDLSDLPF